jgi:hypothetical protein
MMQMEFETLDASGHYNFYRADNESGVYNQQALGSTHLSAVISKIGSQFIYISPFKRTCAGVDTMNAYRLKLDVTGMFHIFVKTCCKTVGCTVCCIPHKYRFLECNYQCLLLMLVCSNDKGAFSFSQIQQLIA